MPEPPSQALARRDDLTVSKMRTPRPAVHDSSASSLSRNDILFALFKHKKKILLGTLVGLAAAVAIFFFFPPIYESDAKLLVRYLVERSTVDTVDSVRNPGGYAATTDTIIGSEIEILSSWDLAVQTAEAVGVKRLLPHASGSPTKETAAGTIASGLALTTHKGSNIIFASYKNRDPELATLVLNELVNRYFVKHLEVHRSAGAFDFVTQQTDQVRARLNQTEDALKEIKEKAGIMSLDDATKDLTGEATKAEEQLHTAEADLAEQQARVRQMSGLAPSVEIVPGTSKTAAPRAGAIAAEPSAKGGDAKSEKSVPPTPAMTQPSAEVIQKYQVLVSGLAKLHQAQLDLFGKYTAESQMVKANQAEIDEVENQRHELEKKYPDLPARVAPAGGSSKGKEFDPLGEAARLAGLQAKKDALASRLQNIKERMAQLSQLAPQIADLERQKQMQETNYKYFQATLEKARVDEALDPSKIPNISAVQRPSPPILVTDLRNKIMLGAAVGGFAIAVAFALLKELFLSGTVRRAVEVEKFVGVSPLMSIPYNPGPRMASAAKRNGKVEAIVPKAAPRDLAPWDLNHFIRPFAEAIRDRLGLYFELHNLTHKPKLVGVAGFSEDAGTSTLAAGLAAALSETNDGKVLLVDVSLGPDQVHPFFKGKPAYPLNAALKPNGAIDAAAENLYLATVGSSSAGPAQLGLKKFFDLMPNLKASDFDYIIFDMPALHQTSPTWGMAAFMDKFLLVVEAEKSTRDAVKRGYRRLVTERENVSVVVNKARSYGPKSLELES
jgi:polysaccharide biosynthesis transport protein